MGFFVVEPRGIEPLYPSVDSGFLTVRWPLYKAPHGDLILKIIKSL